MSPKAHLRDLRGDHSTIRSTVLTCSIGSSANKTQDTAAYVFAEACTTATRAPFCLTPLVSSRVANFDDFAHREPRHRCYHIGKGRVPYGA